MSRKLKLITIGATVAAIAIYAAYTFWSGTSSYVFLDNTFKHAVRVSINGEAVGELEPGESKVHRVTPGETYQVAAKGPRGSVHKGTFVVPSKKSSWAGYGFRGLYVLGPTRPYAVVTMGYGAVRSEVSPFKPDRPFVPLPSAVSEAGINASFPDSVSTARNRGGTSITHLCHIDLKSDALGCGGAD